jgi:hypothetical protein
MSFWNNVANSEPRESKTERVTEVAAEALGTVAALAVTAVARAATLNVSALLPIICIISLSLFSRAPSKK